MLDIVTCECEEASDTRRVAAPCHDLTMATTRDTGGPGKVEALIYSELIRLEGFAREELGKVQARSAALTAGAGIAVAILGSLDISGVTVTAAVFLVLSAGLGVAAQWPRTGKATRASRVVELGRGRSAEDVQVGLTNGVRETIESIERIVDQRSLINRIALVIQLVGLVVLVAGVATGVNDP